MSDGPGNINSYLFVSLSSRNQLFIDWCSCISIGPMHQEFVIK